MPTRTAMRDVYSPERMRKNEWWELITADGVRHMLENFGGRWVIEESGTGMPPLRYVTEQGPGQDGATVRDVFVKSRFIDMVLRGARCSREDFWQERAILIDRLRPNRSVTNAPDPATLRKILPNGEQRDIHCFLDSGADFVAQSNSQWDRWAFNEPIRLFCPDGIWFDPTVVTSTFALSVQSELTFPITFPITFGSGVLNTTLVVPYPGTWMTFPRFTINGPLASPTFRNNSLGVQFTLNYAVPAGQAVIIDLDYGAKVVVNTTTGDNLAGAVEPFGDFTEFRLEPHPRVTDGDNEIQVTGAAADQATTSVVMTHRIRYLALTPNIGA